MLIGGRFLCQVFMQTACFPVYTNLLFPPRVYTKHVTGHRLVTSFGGSKVLWWGECVLGIAAKDLH